MRRQVETDYTGSVIMGSFFSVLNKEQIAQEDATGDAICFAAWYKKDIAGCNNCNPVKTDS